MLGPIDADAELLLAPMAACGGDGGGVVLHCAVAVAPEPGGVESTQKKVASS